MSTRKGRCGHDVALGTLVGTPVLVRAKETTLTQKELALIVGSLFCTNRRLTHLPPFSAFLSNPSLLKNNLRNDSDQIVSLAQVVQPILSTYQGGDKSLTNFRSRGPAEAGQRSKRER